MATTCVRIVTWLFPCPEGANHDCGLHHFFLHILRKTRTRPVVTIATLLLLLRFRRRRTHGFGLSRRRMFITALMVASKTLLDREAGPCDAERLFQHLESLLRERSKLQKVEKGLFRDSCGVSSCLRAACQVSRLEPQGVVYKTYKQQEPTPVPYKITKYVSPCVSM